MLWIPHGVTHWRQRGGLMTPRPAETFLPQVCPGLPPPAPDPGAYGPIVVTQRHIYNYM